MVRLDIPKGVFSLTVFAGQLYRAILANLIQYPSRYGVDMNGGKVYNLN